MHSFPGFGTLCTAELRFKRAMTRVAMSSNSSDSSEYLQVISENFHAYIFFFSFKAFISYRLANTTKHQSFFSRLMISSKD